MACHRRNTCRLCGSTDLSMVLSLAPTPPANAFLAKSDLLKQEPFFPLDIFFCDKCFHVQLLDIVDPEVLFRHYVYVSGTSPTFVEHFRKYSEFVCGEFGLNSSGFVFELGSNDGTLLRFFKDKGMAVLGVDPAISIAEKATEQGIPTLPIFLTKDEAEKIQKQYGAADLVLANNVFAHIDDLTGTAAAVTTLLKPDGVFVFEVSYLLDVMEKTLFDTIYHEHLDYHSVKPLEKFFSHLGMELFHVQRVDSHGGSLRGYVQRKGGKQKVRPSVQDFIAVEEKKGLYRAETFRKFADQINQLGASLNQRLRQLKGDGKKIIGFGAPAKATTLMHHFGIGPEFIDFIVDDSPLKQNLYTPGLHVPVLPFSAIEDFRPDYILVLAWNFAEPILKKLSNFRNNGGHVIVPLPELKEI